MTLRIVYMGSPDFAVPALRALVEAPELAKVVMVVSQPDQPKGRGLELSMPAVKAAALEYDIPVFQPSKMKVPETAEVLRAQNADLFVVAAYGRILPQTLLDIPRVACLNLHASLLPRHRGAAPIAHALLAGDDETGVCLMKMDAGLDTGPVYARVTTRIEDEDDAGTLTDRLAQLGAELLVQKLAVIAAGTLPALPQPSTGETYAGKLNKEDGRIDWNAPAKEVLQRIRAFSPWPSAFTFVQGKRLQVLGASIAHDTKANPGAAVIEGQHLYVGCSQGALELLSVKPEGKRAMRSADYVAGRPFPVGTVFGTT